MDVPADGTVYVYSTSTTTGPIPQGVNPVNDANLGKYHGELTPADVKRLAQTGENKTTVFGVSYYGYTASVSGGEENSVNFYLYASGDGRAYRGYLYVVVESGGVLSDVTVIRY